MPYSSTGRPATALSPMLVASLPSKRQISVPSSRTSTRGRLVGEAGRHPALEHVGRLDDVVVHADEHQVLELHGPPVVAASRRRPAGVPFPDTRVGDHSIVGAVTPQGRGQDPTAHGS